jgi:hypothetical protein
MFKVIVSIFILYTLWGCNAKKEGVLVKTLPISKNDTFLDGYMSTLKMYDFVYPVQIVLDSIEQENKRNKTTEHLVLPELTGNWNKATVKKVRENMLKIKKAFLNSSAELGIDEASKESIVNEIDMYPVNIFQNKKMASYCFEICYSDSILMRPYCHYDCLNYDVNRNTVIKFSDFFDIRSKADSIYFGQLILKAVGQHNFLQQLSPYNDLDFSVNDDYVFFYFDAYELGAPFDIGGAINRKYLNKFIKEIYR